MGKEIEQSGRLTKEDVRDEDESPSCRTFISLDIDKHATSSTSVAFLKRAAVSLVEEGEERAGRKAMQ